MDTQVLAIQRYEPAVSTSTLAPSALSASSTGSGDSWVERIESLNRLHELKDDWDGDGAIAPRNDLLSSAKALLLGMRKNGWVAPTGVAAGPNGTVLIDWQNEKNYFEVEVVAPFQAEWMASIPGKPPEHGKGVDLNASEMLRRVMSA